MAKSVVLAIALALLTGCADRRPPRTPAQLIDEILVQLAAGEIDGADQSSEAAIRRYPGDGGVAACRATVHDLMWRDELAIASWREVVASKDRAGWAVAVARGRLGDQLFVAGRYGESLAPLLAGVVEDEAVRRHALVSVARELPFRRKQIGPLVTEQPLLDGALPEFVCSIGELRRPFAVDTGSSMTTISLSLAEAAGVRALTDMGSIPDGTGKMVKASIGVLDGFAVGEIWFGSVPVLVVDDERLAMRDLFGGPDRAPVGVLGLDLLSLFRMTLDPVRRSLVLELPRRLPEATSVQCLRSQGRCLVPVAIEGERLWFVLDTGASHSSLSPAGLAKLPLGEARATPGFRRVRTAAGGGLSVREVKNLVLRVSQTRFSGVDLPVITREIGGVFPMHGVLGIDLLRQCRMVIDDGRVRMEPSR
jgi:predicted aspartyl protease